jgi:hypothetical protein
MFFLILVKKVKHILTTLRRCIIFHYPTCYIQGLKIVPNFKTQFEDKRLLEEKTYTYFKYRHIDTYIEIILECFNTYPLVFRN